MSNDNVPLAFDKLSDAGNNRCCGRRAKERGSWSTRLSEPARHVWAAWIVALFFLLAGFSVLVFQVREAGENGVRVASPRCYPPVVASVEDRDELPDRGDRRAEASEAPGMGDSTLWGSADDQRISQELPDCSSADPIVLQHSAKR
jgi:hypothetical protein